MSVPEFYDDLDLSFAKAWDFIELGATKRASPAHTPVVTTVDNQGRPQSRVMVLRHADRPNRRLRFHTDVRAAKVDEANASGFAAILMYDPAEKLQLRLSGQLHHASEDAETDEAWRNSTTFARRCYMAERAPGSVSDHPTSGLPEWIEGKQPEEADLVGARTNFAILWFEVLSLEFLYLANAGHRRAKWEWNEPTASWSGCWLVP